jgi:hypothetical protein
MTIFPHLLNDQLLQMYIVGLKLYIHSEIRLSRPKNLVESRSMSKMIKMKLITQQGVSFEPQKNTTNYSPPNHHNDTNITTQKGTQRRKTTVANVV